MALHQRRDALAPPATSDRIAACCAYAIGQLQALNASHQTDREYEGVRKMLSQGEIERGRRAGEQWVCQLWAKYGRDLPDRHERGSVPRASRLFGDMDRPVGGRG